MSGIARVLWGKLPAGLAGARNAFYSAIATAIVGALIALLSNQAVGDQVASYGAGAVFAFRLIEGLLLQIRTWLGRTAS